MPLALILVRWLHLSASILLASLFLFEAAIVLPATRKLSAGIGQLLDTIHRLTCRTALWTLLVALMSWFAWSWLVASTMTGDDLIECLQSGDWLTVLTGTQFGHIWLFRLTSAYGQLLVSKLILFFAMVGFGAWNLFLLKPIAVDLPTVSVVQQKSAVRSLLRNVLWEMGLGTVVILIVGLLGTTPPPMR